MRGFLSREIAELSYADFQNTINLNLGAPIFLTKMILPKMTKNGIVINISSISSVMAYRQFYVYGASKAGIDRFTTTLAKECTNLKIIGILPGPVDTLMLRKANNRIDQSVVMQTNDISDVVLRAAKGEFNSGDLIAVLNNQTLEWWKNRDKYIVVNVDKE